MDGWVGIVERGLLIVVEVVTCSTNVPEGKRLNRNWSKCRFSDLCQLLGGGGGGGERRKEEAKEELQEVPLLRPFSAVGSGSVCVCVWGGGGVHICHVDLFLVKPKTLTTSFLFYKLCVGY